VCFDHAEWTGQEPDVEVRATVSPAVEVNASDVAECQDRPFDTRDNPTEILL
jgi:hypothetical protein